MLLWPNEALKISFKQFLSWLDLLLVRIDHLKFLNLPLSLVLNVIYSFSFSVYIFFTFVSKNKLKTDYRKHTKFLKIAYLIFSTIYYLFSTIFRAMLRVVALFIYMYIYTSCFIEKICIKISKMGRKEEKIPT